MMKVTSVLLSEKKPSENKEDNINMDKKIISESTERIDKKIKEIDRIIKESSQTKTKKDDQTSDNKPKK